MTSDQRVPSVSTTRIALLVLVPLAVVLGLRAETWAALTLKTWNGGETLTANDLNANFDAIKTEIANGNVRKVATPADVTGIGNIETILGSVTATWSGRPVYLYGNGSVFNSSSVNNNVF